MQGLGGRATIITRQVQNYPDSIHDTGTGRSESAEQRHFTASGTLSVFLRYKPIWILTEIIIIVTTSRVDALNLQAKLASGQFLSFPRIDAPKPR